MTTQGAVLAVVVVLTWDVYGNLGASPFSNVPSQGPENGVEGEGQEEGRDQEEGSGKKGEAVRISCISVSLHNSAVSCQRDVQTIEKSNHLSQTSLTSVT